MKKSPQDASKYNELRYLDSGDGIEANPPHTQRFVDNRHPECLQAGECAAYHSHRPAHQCRSHAETQRSSVSSRGPQFTPEMIRDQELLVTSMSQQGIPENLIRRQFERLIDEQSKQLRLLGDNTKSAEGNAPRARKNNSEETSKRDNDRTRLVEPSSLLKIRMRKEEMDFQKRNNGLQDPAVAQNILKKCSFKSKGIKKYSDEENVTQGQIVRLNGAQDRSEMESVETKKVEVRERQKSANGLENARNLQRDEEPERNAVSSQKEQTVETNVQPSSFNNLTYWPELQEPRVIGGLTYFARKPQCIPNVPGLLCDNHSCCAADQAKATRT